MSFNLQSAIIFLLLVLPGITAYAYARLYVPRPRAPTALDELAGAVQNTLLIHIVGVILFTAALATWARWIRPVGWDELVAGGVSGYIKQHPLRTLIIGTSYALYLLLASPTFGALNVSNRLSTTFLAALRRTPLIHRLVPEQRLNDEPVWYAAFQLLRLSAQQDSVYLRIRMKNRDVYHGRLVLFPILGNDIKSKDFLIDDVIYLPQGDREAAEHLNRLDIPGFGGVLLNAENCDAIEFVYYSPDDLLPPDDAPTASIVSQPPLPPPDQAP